MKFPLPYVIDDQKIQANFDALTFRSSSITNNNTTIINEVTGQPFNAGWANVKDYGAKGDGSTDDRGAIQTALDTHGVVFVPPGTYVIGSPLYMRAGQKFIGFGASHAFYDALGSNRTILRAASGFSGAMIRVWDFTLSLMESATGVYISGLFLECADEADYGIHFGGRIYDCQIERVTVTNSTSHGFYHEGFVGGRDGQDISHLECQVATAGGDAYHWNAYQYDHHLTNCNAINVFGDGYHMSSGSSHFDLVNCKAQWGRGYGVYIDHPAGVSMHGGFVDSNRKDGVYITSGEDYADATVIQGVRIRRNGRNALDPALGAAAYGDSNIKLVSNSSPVILDGVVQRYAANDKQADPTLIYSRPEYGLSLIGDNKAVTVSGHLEGITAAVYDDGSGSTVQYFGYGRSGTSAIASL